MLNDETVQKYNFHLSFGVLLLEGSLYYAYKCHPTGVLLSHASLYLEMAAVVNMGDSGTSDI